MALASHRWATATLVLGVAAALPISAAIDRTYGRFGAIDAFMVGYSVIWLVVGHVAVRVHSARLGMLMTVFGLADLTSTFGSAVYAPGTVMRVARSAAILVLFVQPVLVYHMALTYPSGRAYDPATRLLIRAAYPLGVLSAVLMTVFARPTAQLPRCLVNPCVEPLLTFTVPAATRLLAYQVLDCGWAVLYTVGLVLLGWRYHRMTPRMRRLRRWPTATVVIAGTLALTQTVWAVAAGQQLLFFAPAMQVALMAAGAAAIPFVFLLGLLRERLDLARVSDLVCGLADTAPEDLEPALRTALGDPGVRVLPAAPTRPRPGQVVTPIGVGVVVLHDRSLLEEPRLVSAVTATVTLALANAALREQVRDQLDEVRASRARIVDAADTARRRIERDLHDGAQQRLLAIGMTLQAARDDPRLLVLVETELRAAIAELRELARGLHPAILTSQGLPAALRQLVLRHPGPVVLDCPPQLSCDAATAYFVVSECLTNAARHARASLVTVTVRAGHRLVVDVRDDGIGGAVATPGGGLSGLVDRVDAADGTLSLHSPPGGGTTVRVTLPLTS